MASNIYSNFLVKALGSSTHINLTSDTLKMGLLTSSYTPSLTSDTFWGDVNGNEVSGTGYTAGGASVTSATLTLTAANSWSVLRANTTSYSYGAIVRPASGNGNLYRAAVAGTSASVAPTYPTTVGQTVADGGVTWGCVGDAALVFSSASVGWVNATFTAAYGVIYDASPGTAGTDPLILLITFSSTQSPSATNFTVLPDPTLGWFVFSPPS